jgi:hypothetical protein
MTGSTWRKADMAIGDAGKIVNKHNPNSVLYGTIGAFGSSIEFELVVEGSSNDRGNVFLYKDWDFYQEQELPKIPGSLVEVRDPSVFYHLNSHGVWVSDKGDRFRPEHMPTDWVLIYDNKKETA